MKIFISWLRPLHYNSGCNEDLVYARNVHIATTVLLYRYCRERSQLIKMAMDIVFQRKKKHNSNRAKSCGSGEHSYQGKKTVLIRTDCINGLSTSTSTSTYNLFKTSVPVHNYYRFTFLVQPGSISWTKRTLIIIKFYR
jgi:hypothetical protein